MLNAGKDLAAVLQAMEVSESTLDRWRSQYGGIKVEGTGRLKQLDDNRRQGAHREQDTHIWMPKRVGEGNW